jgi:hypothetical protein
MEERAHIAGIQGNGTKPMTIGRNNSAHAELKETIPGGVEGDGAARGRGRSDTSGTYM